MFADHAGTIGPLACADLASDFGDNADRLLGAFGEEIEPGWLREKYGLWRDAFELAAPHGLVLLV
jgi:hypothetical protein